DIERAHLRDPDDRTVTIVRRLPPAALRAWLRRDWIPVWDVPAGERSEPRVLQSPVGPSIRAPEYSWFVGPRRGLSTTVLEGRSWGFGTMFAPGAVAVLHEGPLADVVDGRCELESIPALRGVTAALRALMADGPADAEVHTACCALIEERLARLPAPGEEDLLVNAIVEEVENDPSLFAVG